ncbi:MAG: DUF3303 domain-containing protein [Alphaproteobacteria bacterium]
MLFLVISTPAPTEPSAVRDRRQRYWEWIAPLRADGTVRSVHARVGRGAVVLFDLDTAERLHRHLNEWADIIPATFDIYPLIDVDAARSFLAGAAD